MIGDSVAYSSRLRITNATGVEIRSHTGHRHSRTEGGKSLRRGGSSTVTDKDNTRMISSKDAVKIDENMRSYTGETSLPSYHAEAAAGMDTENSKYPAEYPVTSIRDVHDGPKSPRLSSKSPD